MKSFHVLLATTVVLIIALIAFAAITGTHEIGAWGWAFVGLFGIVAVYSAYETFEEHRDEVISSVAPASYTPAPSNIH